MVVNNPLTILSPVDQAMGAGFVYQSSSSAGETIDLIDSTIRKNFTIGTGIGKVPFYVIADLSPVQMRQLALEIDPLPDSGICMELQLVPEFGLPHENQCGTGMQPEIRICD